MIFFNDFLYDEPTIVFERSYYLPYPIYPFHFHNLFFNFTTRIVNIPCNYSNANLTSRYTFANFVFENFYKIEHISRGQVGIPSRVHDIGQRRFCLFSGHKNSSYTATSSPIASPSFKGWMRGKSRCIRNMQGNNCN